MPLAKLGDVELYYDLFNRHVAELLASVEAGRWAGRS
jgi:hypothetical protein